MSGLTIGFGLERTELCYIVGMILLCRILSGADKSNNGAVRNGLISNVQCNSNCVSLLK